MHPLIQEILDGFLTIFKSPSNDWSVMWLLAPIFLFWIVLEIYFDKHKKEALGWNTALGDGLSLFWVAITCVKYVVGQEFSPDHFWRSFSLLDLLQQNIYYFLKKGDAVSPPSTAKIAPVV